MDLTGKVALVTGASRGIGRAVATALAGAGASVVISSRKQDALDAAAVAIEDAVPGAAVLGIAANAGDPEGAAACVEGTMRHFGAVDVLVNNAATNPQMGPIIDMELAAWDKTYQVNVRGAVVWCQLVWRAWMREHGGAIVNMVSVGGLQPVGDIGAYNSTKAALIHVTKHLARELAPGVRVNAIAPGLVRTDMASVLIERLSARGEIAAHFPLGRVGEPDDVANAALFLASDRASWITGHTLTVDGGQLISNAPSDL
jgi:NAD(P)-dependent dehydrogenase (short-subunit alcohol dehydrogenase family)